MTHAELFQHDLKSLNDQQLLIQSLETLHNVSANLASISGNYSQDVADKLESHFYILEEMRRRVNTSNL